MNNVILDVIIGILFIFLLYSLLATSVQEFIAMVFALRARNLRRGIVVGMLSNSSDDSRWQCLIKGFICFFEDIYHLAVPRKKSPNPSLGQAFYSHPLIKHYGSSQIFPNPSYLPSTNFSTVLIEVLLADYERLKANPINTTTAKVQPVTAAIPSENLLPSTDMAKIQDLLAFYSQIYASGKPISGFMLQKDTWQILQLHFKKSLNLEDFSGRLQTWFNDSMDRIAGWYKRQVQVILFLIGLFLAQVFNVDVIQISGKLSTDKDSRDQLVKMAITQADSYKDDPRVQESQLKKIDSTGSIFAAYNEHLIYARRALDSSVVPANQLLALGWGDFGKKRDSMLILASYLDPVYVCRSGVRNTRKACFVRNQKLLDSVFQEHRGWLKLAYVGSESLRPSKLAGLLLTAFAISLGAPFWFDLLNKVMKLRASGRKELTPSGHKKQKSSMPSPVVVNVGTAQTAEEAVG